MRSRIARFAMRRRATVVGALILVFVMAGTALAVAPGSNFRLGVVNSISGYLTTLTGSNNGYMLAIKNTNTNAAARGLRIDVVAGHAPIVVNGTAGKALGLNADKVDGKNAADFYAAGSKVADSVHADSADNATNAGYATSAGSATTAGSATNATNATNAGTVDGYNANELSRGNVVQDAGNALGSTYASVGAVTLDVPRPGRVLVQVVSMSYATNPSTCPCNIHMYLRDATSGSGTFFYASTMDNGSGTIYTPLSHNFLFNVTAAGTRSFEVWMFRSTGTAIYTDFTASATFIPFGPTGAASAGAAPQTIGKQQAPQR